MTPTTITVDEGRRILLAAVETVRQLDECRAATGAPFTERSESLCYECIRLENQNAVLPKSNDRLKQMCLMMATTVVILFVAGFGGWVLAIRSFR